MIAKSQSCPSSGSWIKKEEKIMYSILQDRGTCWTLFIRFSYAVPSLWDRSRMIAFVPLARPELPNRMDRQMQPCAIEPMSSGALDGDLASVDLHPPPLIRQPVISCSDSV